MDKKDKAETPREKFKRVASARTSKIINMLKLLGNCSNKYVYEYTEEDVKKIYNAIETELRLSRDRYNKDKHTDKFKL